MAQVRKYATGGGAEKKKETPPILFHWDGIGDYNVEDLEKTYATEIENVLSQYDLDEEDKRKIRDRAYLTLQEIKSGRMGNRNVNGTWVNVTPGFESTGMNEKERKKILGLSIGKKRYVKDADFYQNLAYDVLDQMISKTNIYTAPKDQVVTPAKVTDFNFGNYLTDYYFYNKQFDPNNWDFANAKANIGSRLAEFKKKVTDSNLSDTDKNDLLGRISQVETALQTEDPNDDYYGLVRLMNDPRRWFDKYYVPISNDPNQKPLTEEERKSQEDKKRFDEAYKARLASDNDYWNQNYSSWTYDPFNRTIGNKTIQDTSIDDYDTTKTFDFSILPRINEDPNIARLFHSYISNPRTQKFLKDNNYYQDGWFYLPNTQDLTNNMLLRVNPTTYTIEKVPFTSFKAGEELYRKNLELELLKELNIVPQWTTSIPSNKNGGILKLQQGGFTVTLDDFAKQEQERKAKNNTQNNKIDSSKEKNTTAELDLSNLSAADKSRLWSIGLDLVSGASSFVPFYGTAVSAVTGLGSTAANAYADYEKYGLGTAALNLIPNLALDAVGLIPGGGIVAKGAKAVRAIKKSAALATLVGTAMSLNGVADAWTRIKEGNGTIEDYQALTSTISGLARIPGGQFVKGKAVKKGLLKEVHPLEIEGKKYNLDEDTYKAVLKASSKEAQENILKQAGFDIKLNDKITSKLGKRIRNSLWNPGNPEYILTEKGKNASWAYRPGLNLNLNKGNRNYNSTKPEANVGNNRVVNDINQATKNFYSQRSNSRTININDDKVKTNNSEYKIQEKIGKEIINNVNKTVGYKPSTKVATDDLRGNISYTSPSPAIDGTRTIYWDQIQKINDSRTKRVANEQKLAKQRVNEKELNKLIHQENFDKHLAKVKAANAKKRQDYVNWWISELNRRSRERVLPTKENKPKISNKNKESKGYINKHQQGGIVKGAGGFRIGAKSKWTLDDRNKALANYNFAGDVQSYLNSGSDIDSYIAAFNGGEDLYDRMVGDTNYFTNMSGNYRKEDPLAYQRQMTFRNTNKGFDDLIRGSIIGYGTTEGASNFDKYLGDRTYNRTLGYLTPEQAAAYNKQINQFGIELFQSPNNKNHYRLRKIPGWINPNKPIGTAEDIMGDVEMPTLPTAEQVLTKSGGTGRNAGLDPESENTNSNSNSNSGNASAAISDLLGLGRLAGTIWTNNRIAKTLKNSLSPLLIDPPQIRRQVMGDLATKTYMENLGAEANRIGSRPITSDASLQLGQALDYNNRANEYRIKGYLADKQAIDKTSLAAQEAAEQNAIARVDAANRNRASMLGIRQAKANIEAQRKSANWSQAVAPWLMDKEFRLRQNDQLLKELDYQEQDYLNRKTLNDSVSEAQDDFNRAKNAYIAAGNEESTWIGSPAYEQALNQLNQAKQKAADIYNQARIKAKKSIYSSPWIMFKSGGKLSYEEKAALEHDKAVNKALLNDSKEFNKIIRESKKENNKLILSLSGLTKELVIKSMTYGG